MLSKMLRGSVNNTTNPIITDANFKQVSLLLHGDGTNGAQNNTFLDSSTNNFTVTRNGNTTQGTNTPFSQAAGYWSNYFNGTSDYLTAPAGSATFGLSDFTIECWFNPSSTTFGWMYIQGIVGSLGIAWSLTTSRVSLYCNYGTAITSTSNLSLGTWYNVVVTRVGITYTLYINGVSQGTFLASNNVTAVTPTIGGGSGAYFNGYISNMRLNTGTAVYTSNFTPSTTPLTAISGTSLLTCQSNYFKDNSSNNFTITPTGTPSVQPFSPFAPTSAYSTSVNGGSIYFDGTGDYLTTPSNTAFDAGTGDFTVEFWMFQNNQTGIQTMFEYGGYTTGILIRLNGTSFDVWVGGTAVSTTSATKINEWEHIAITRSSGIVKRFNNGVQIGTNTSMTGNISINSNVMVGGSNDTSGNQNFNGYISNVRYVVGTAIYTSAFTPPTAPLTAITNTSLLLSGTNAGIYDNAIKNDLETVGNAQVSTSVTKFGTGSMSFDGTGDWLTSPDTPNLQLGTGNFTIEGWVYLNAVGSARGFVSKGTSTTGWSVSANSSNQVVFSYTSSTITSTGTLSVSTWYFVTVVREGTGTNQTKIYINGTNDGTGTVATDFNQTSIMYVGADRVAGSALNGYIDDLRITKGIARYTANFTPPTSAFPNS